jgi:hypothetical protein
MPLSPRRQALADALGLGVLLLVLLDLLHPSLLLLPTIAAGGDTPCHYPTAVWLQERLLPQLRLHGWYPGAYLGQPLLLYYFPLPFVLMASLAPALGMPVAFKLGSALGVFLLPLLAYVSFRLMRLAFPAPLLAAAAAFVFLYVEDNPIWGGTIASTLAGEFSYTYGIGFALLFLGLLVRARSLGRGPWWPASALALTAYAHGYAVLWAGLSAAGLLAFDPASPTSAPAHRDPHHRRWQTPRLRLLLWLVAVALVAFALAAPSLVPLLAGWGWTTPYDDAWIELAPRLVFPPLLQPLLLAAALGLGAAVVKRIAGDPIDARLLLLAFAALAGACLAAAGPGLGVIDVRFLPFAQLALALVGALSLAGWLARLALADVAALGLVLVAVAGADARSRVLRSWVDWNYSGLEAKELWPAWAQLNGRLQAASDDARVAVEYGPIHERAGSIRMYETLPFFSGRATLEGVYNQAAITTHPIYYLASELFARSPNPFRSRLYSTFDPESALPRLRLFNVSQVVAVSPELESFLDARSDVVREAVIPPYALYRLRDPGGGYVEPLAFAPMRAPLERWRDAAYRWMSRKPSNRALLVFTDDTRFEAAADTWSPPRERPLPGGVEVRSRVEPEAVDITTSRPGHPLLVKISYHPRWRAEGADGPYLVSPGLMLVVPRQAHVRLTYAARTWADRLGDALWLGALALGLATAPRRRARSEAAPVTPPAPAPSSSERLEPARPWAPDLRLLPILLLAGLASLRLVADRRPKADVAWLDGRASGAYAQGRYEDAAEYARHALEASPANDARRGERLCLRGEALLHAGHDRLASLAFAGVVDVGSGPYRPQALYSGALARERAGDKVGAAAWRALLRAEYPATPWAARLEAAAR